MGPRLDYVKLAIEPARAMFELTKAVARGGLEEGLLELVKLRVSQMNGCGFCLDMHSKDARAAGETEQRVYLLSVWREAPLYTDRERAALAWAEALTRIEGGAPDDVYEEASRHFDEKEMVDLTWAIVAINGWNRVAIGFKSVPGSYKPAGAVHV
jgi:AhpD family alkylhydroperoxidase